MPDYGTWPPKGDIIELSECDLHYIQQGSGPDIIWIPGGDQSCDIFSAQFAAFRDDFRCISFDPRGVGKTVTKVPSPWPIPDFAKDLAEFITKVCNPPVIITGLSMGALITQEMAFSYPDLIRLAIPMGTAARKTGFMREWEDAEINFAADGHTLTPEFSTAHYAVLSYPSEVLGDDELWEKCKPFITGAYEERDPKMLAAQWQACLSFETADKLPNCQVPMHVIGFSEDMQTPPQRGRLVAELAGNGHFHLLEGLGHCSMFGHKPEVVNACVREIIESYN